MKKELYSQSYPKLEREWDEVYLEVGKDPIPQIIVIKCLRRIKTNPIMYDNAFALRNHKFLPG